MTIHQRFKELLFALNTNGSQFSKKINVSSTSINKIIQGNGLPSSKIIIPLIENYPEVNIYWLLVGEGEMFREGTAKNKQAEGKTDINSTTDNIQIQKLTTEIKYLKKEIKVLEASNTTLSNQIKDKDMIISLLQKK
ncbi:hypothetical protein [Aureispira anguillae]|uniref:HTH cro/C1-type domain-containing protein n=1 Tax=Aureispira anguillae TaxID=2864201 RepID=A0A916DUP5_9BACT|nr:hypothetical protein [Aureispira anguillae]BDS12715.1 hypothetical protein AsAng_0034400 [Aureispira anguillae]